MPGRCPWHDCVVDQEQLLACREGTPPTSSAPTCIYLRSEKQTVSERFAKKLRGQKLFDCTIHGECTLFVNQVRKASCCTCKDKTTSDDPDLRKKWVDPLHVTDRNRNKTDVLRNFLNNGAAFLVGGGPSLKQVDYTRLGERGVFSLGVNNVAGLAPVSAFVCSDPPLKFHWGIFSDPKIMKFLPIPKLRPRRGKLRKKTEDGRFVDCGKSACDCPNVWGFGRRSWIMCDDTWFTEPEAAWGNHDDGRRKTGGAKTVCTTLLGLRVLQYLGAKTIFLLGHDFFMDPRAEVDKNYAFPQHRTDGAIRNNNRQLAIVANWLELLRPTFEKFGFNVYNCNQYSHLRAFPYVPYEEALLYCKGDVPSEPFSLDGWYEKNDGTKKDDSGTKSLGSSVASVCMSESSRKLSGS